MAEFSEKMPPYPDIFTDDCKCLTKWNMTVKVGFLVIIFSARKWRERRILHHLPQIPCRKVASLRREMVTSDPLSDLRTHQFGLATPLKVIIEPYKRGTLFGGYAQNCTNNRIHLDIFYDINNNFFSILWVALSELSFSYAATKMKRRCLPLESSRWFWAQGYRWSMDLVEAATNSPLQWPRPAIADAQ